MNLEALHKISYGLYVITSGKSDNFNGQIANTIFQATSEPATIAASINKHNFTHEFIRESNIFAVSVLSKNTPLKFTGHFGLRSGRDVDKFKGMNYKVGKTGAPIVLDHVDAYSETEVIREVDAGTHIIFIDELVDAEILTNEEPMTYAYYMISRGV